MFVHFQAFFYGEPYACSCCVCILYIHIVLPMRFLATTAENSTVLCILESQPYFTHCRRFFAQGKYCSTHHQHRRSTSWVDCGPWPQSTTSTTVQPAGDCDSWPHPTSRDSSFWWLFILPLLAVLQTSHCRESNRSLKMVVGACQSC